MLNQKRKIRFSLDAAPAVDTGYIASAIETVKETIMKILNDDSFEIHKSYQLIRELVLQRQDKELFDWVKLQCQGIIDSSDPTDLRAFQRYEEKIRIISNCLAYMNSKQCNIQSTLLMLYTCVIDNRVYDCILQNKSKMGIEMVQKLHLLNDFHDHVIDTIKINCRNAMVPNELSVYLDFIDSTIKHELAIANEFYPFISSKVEEVLVYALFECHFGIVKEQFATLYSLSKSQKTLFFDLVKQAHLFIKFGEYLESYLLSESMTFIKLQDDQVIIHFINLISLCYQMLSIDHLWIDHYKKAFSRSINAKRQSKDCTELLVKYADVIMKGKFDQELNFNKQCEYIILLFRCLNDKDVFIALYKVYLARRLLLQKSASLDQEKYFVHLMRLEIGQSNIQHLEGMFTDIASSASDLTAFLGSIQNSDYFCQFQFTGQVLTRSRWPSYPFQKLTLPDNMNTIYSKFVEYHKNKSQNKILTLVPLLSKCVITARFKTPKELVCNALQASIIVTLGVNKLSFELLREKLAMDVNDLKTTLESLMNPKCQIILTEVLYSNVG